MLGVELVGGDAAGAMLALRERGILVNAVSETALRLIPPLVIDDAQVELAVGALADVLATRA
jgi:acetylornithine aminotransferase